MDKKRRSYYACSKFVQFLIIKVVFLKVSIVFAQSSLTQPSVSDASAAAQKDSPYVSTTQSGYICYNKNVKCTIWNADKVVRPNVYKDIRFNFGDFNLSFPKGRPTISSNDKRFSIALGLYANYDMGAYIGRDKRNNGYNMAGWNGYLRRGRPIIQVSYDDFMLTVSPDIGRFFLAHHHIFDANLRYTGFKNTVIVWGIALPMGGLYDSGTSRDFILAERPMVVDMFRNIAGGEPRVAVNAIHWNRRYIVSLAFTGQRLDYTNFQDGQKGGIFRFAFRPIIARDYEMHLGVSGAFAVHGRNRLYSMGVGQETRVFMNRSYLSSGIKGVNSVWAIGPEFGFRWKRFLLQSEYYSFYLSRKDTDGVKRPDLHFSGWYAALNYVIFGQPRPYSESRGVFERPQGNYFNPATGEWGALEWSVRWSAMDLNRYTHYYDQKGTLLGVQGGTQKIIATGFNWYPSPHFRVMLDYNHTFTTASRNNIYNRYGRQSNIILSRLQITF